MIFDGKPDKTVNGYLLCKARQIDAQFAQTDLDRHFSQRGPTDINDLGRLLDEFPRLGWNRRGMG